MNRKFFRTLAIGFILSLIMVLPSGRADAQTIKFLPELGRSSLVSGGVKEVSQLLVLDFSRIEKELGLKQGQGAELKRKLLLGEWRPVDVKAEFDGGQAVVLYYVMLGAGYKPIFNVAPTWSGPRGAMEVVLADGTVVHIFSVCGNFAKKIPLPKPAPTPVPYVAPPPLPPITLIEPPPPTSTTPPVTPEQVPQYGWEKDTGAYIGRIFSEKGRHTNYWGASGIVYDPRRDIGGGWTMQEGARLSYGGWDGDVGHSVPSLQKGEFDGRQVAIQGGERFIHGTDNFQVFGGYAERKDSFQGEMAGFDFDWKKKKLVPVVNQTDSSQRAKQISVLTSTDIRTPSLGPVKRIEAYLQGNIELSRSAEANWNGEPILNPEGFNTSNVVGGVDGTLYEGNSFDAGIGLHGSHDFNDDATTGLELRGWGATKNRALKPYAGLGYAWSKPGDSAFGNVGVSSDLDPIIDWIWDKLTGKSRPKAPEVGPEPAGPSLPPLQPLETVSATGGAEKKGW